VSGTVVGGQHLGFSSAPLDFPHLGCALWLRRDSKIRFSDMELGVAFFFFEGLHTFARCFVVPTRACTGRAAARDLIRRPCCTDAYVRLDVSAGGLSMN